MFFSKTINALFQFRHSLCFAVFVLLQLAYPRNTNAADIALNLSVEARDEIVSVTVTNTGIDIARGLQLKVELGNEKYEKVFPYDLAPKHSHTERLSVDLPSLPGSYSLITRVSYLNDGVRLSVVDVGLFNYQEKKELKTFLEFSDIHLRDIAQVFLRYDKRYSFKLILPEEITIKSTRELESGVLLFLENQFPHFHSNYAVFAVLESVHDGKLHQTQVVSRRLLTSKVIKTYSLFSPSFFAITALIGFSASMILYLSLGSAKSESITKIISLIRYSFSVFVVSTLFFIFRTLHVLPDKFLSELYQLELLLPGKIGSGLVLGLRSCLEALYFSGGNYDSFKLYVADPLFIYIATANYFVIRYLIRPNPSRDKYWQLMLFTFSLLPIRRRFIGELEKGKLIFWSKLTKVGILTIMVKAFYVPLLCTWAIDQTGNLQNLFSQMSWSFYNVNRFAVAFIIFLDVVIFTGGYVTELPQLKNQIKSVEPTLLGWAVCLMCYPPFNQFSFILFDEPLNEYWQPVGETGSLFINLLVTLLWAIYTWASIALGWKASNLTNRGIVDWGPYRYIRHPAYVAKIGLWIVSSYFFGTYNFFLIIAFVVVYSLRAWTEERHLSSDPDYLKYKKRVPWKIIPWVW